MGTKQPANFSTEYSPTSRTTHQGSTSKTPIHPRCQKGHHYLLNNYTPGCFGNGKNAYTDTSASNTVFTIPPSSTPSIGDDLIKNHKVS